MRLSKLIALQLEFNLMDLEFMHQSEGVGGGGIAWLRGMGNLQQGFPRSPSLIHQQESRVTAVASARTSHVNKPSSRVLDRLGKRHADADRRPLAHHTGNLHRAVQ